MMRLAILAFLASASALPPWNSTDMIRTKQQDIEKQGAIRKKVALLEKETSDADAALKNREIILKISQQQLSAAKTSASGFPRVEATEKDTLANMVEAQRRAHDKMLNCTETTKQAYEKLKEAREAWRHAENVTVAARAASNAHSDALDAAKDHLQMTVLQDPNHALAAQADVDKKEKELKEAKEAVSKAQNREEKAEAVLKEVQDHASKSWEVEKDAKQALSEAGAHVTAQEGKLKDISTKNQPRKVVISRLTDAVGEQAAIVKNLTAVAKAKHDALRAAIKEATDMKAEIGRDSKCIADLQAKESIFSQKGNTWKTTRSAYIATTGEVHEHLKGVLWLVKDELAEAIFDLHQVQKKCARGVKVPDMAAPVKPPTDTGGTCAILDCYSSRNAECLVVDGSHKCICKDGTYAEAGRCVDRGDPLQATALLAGRVSDLDVVPLAAAAAALATLGGVAAAFALARRRSLLQVSLPEDALG